MVFFFQAEDGIRDLVRSRGLGDVYKRQDGDTDYIVGNFGTNRRYKNTTAVSDGHALPLEGLSLIHI